jgi:hypothetical protein
MNKEECIDLKTLDNLRQSSLIAYEYRRGSHMYHLNVPGSDIDTGGVFLGTREMLLGLRSRYVEQVADEKNDTVFYELGRWVELLLKSNPTALEALFAPKDCVIGPVHPAVQEIIDRKDIFLSQDCFKPLYRYAIDQIQKARGLNKKIVNPVTERKDILDFCNTLSNTGGSQPVKEYLEKHGLLQKYCGLVSIPRMPGIYEVYYDFAAHFEYEKVTVGKAKEIARANGLLDGLFNVHISRISKGMFLGYNGVVHPDDNGKSNEVRLSSVPKGEKPVFLMHFNKDAYESHCRQYREYKDWEKNRNPLRYESNLGHNYDSKNVMHCMRLVRMARELAAGEGFNVVRDKDRDFLLDIRSHKFEYEEIMKMLEHEKAAMEAAIASCTLPEHVDAGKVNDLLVSIRKRYQL